MNTSKTSLDIIACITNLTTEPGVYQMLDKTGRVLYVGKAANLKKRVSSYFSKHKHYNNKIHSLINQIASIEVSITRTETEALLLESSLIKSLSPKYNVLMRDDKSYPYIHLSSNHVFPRIEMVRCKNKPKNGTYFGPYPNVTVVRDTLNTIHKIFKLRNCRDSYFSARSRPCLQYQIKRCTAPCTNYISPRDYQQSVNDAIQFLQGKSQLIIKELTNRMETAVNRLAYEEAATLRDQIKSLRLVQESQGMILHHGDADVIAIDASLGFGCIQCVSVRNGQVIANQSFFPTVPSLGLTEETITGEVLNELRQQIFEAFVAFYYIEQPERIPAVLILDNNIYLQQLDFLQESSKQDKETNKEYITEDISTNKPTKNLNVTNVPEWRVIETLLAKLRGKACHIQIRPRGIKARWLDFARNNLQLAMAKHMTSHSTMTIRYQALTELLHLSHPILRMECFDISHTQGEATVASCVVFDDNGPCKKEYRQFNITGITPGDDYAAIKQAITRRFKRLLSIEESMSFDHCHDHSHLPDILIIDGGKGQVESARHALDDLGVIIGAGGVTLLGIAKGPTRKAGLERLILITENKGIKLPIDSPALHLLQYIRDEAHRFAITTHRKKRQKTSFSSSLENIEGIGPKRKHVLLQRFGGLRELAKAPMEEIIKVTGISAELASRIFQYFHPEQGT